VARPAVDEARILARTARTFLVRRAWDFLGAIALSCFISLALTGPLRRARERRAAIAATSRW